MPINAAFMIFFILNERYYFWQLFGGGVYFGKIRVHNYGGGMT